MKFKALLTVLLGIACLLGGVAGADVDDLAVTPANTNINASASVFVKVPAGANPDTVSIAQSLDPARPAPVLKISPGNTNFTWNMDCNVPTGGSASSPRGQYRLNGRTIRNTGPLSAPCSVGTTIPESISIPNAVKKAVLEAALAQPVSSLTATGRLKGTVVVGYRRTFADGGTDTDSHQLRFNFSIQGDVNQSRLVAASGDSRSALPNLARANVSTQVNWTAVIETIGSGTRLDIRSDRIEFRNASGQLLQSQTKPLSKNFDPRFAKSAIDKRDFSFSGILLQEAHAQNRSSSLVFTETIGVPSSVIERSRQSGSNIIRIVRIFSDGNNTATASIDIPIGGQAGAAFQITRIELRFDNNQHLSVVDQDDKVQVIADINYTGTGLLRAMWKIAPVFGAGTPFFRPLPPSSGITRNIDFSKDGTRIKQTHTVVRQYLTSFQLVSLRSPEIPTSHIGQYLVTLTILDPELGFEAPVIELYVGAGLSESSPDPAEILKMSVQSPANGDVVDAGTELSWGPVGLTRAYQYVIYEGNSTDSPIVTGAVIPGNHPGATLSPVVRDHLISGRHYWWQVMAIDDLGRIHGRSDLKQITIP